MADVAIAYLDDKRVTAKRATTPPIHRSASGYGSKIPTQWLLQIDGKRWHRVYVVQWSNAGSCYVLVGGERLFLGSYDPGLD